MKISCDVIRDLLPLYVEDMLSNDSKNIVDEHIEQCESCRDELKKLSGDEVHSCAVNQIENKSIYDSLNNCLLYTSPSPRDYAASRMPSSA